jgi:hypothetical protein
MKAILLISFYILTAAGNGYSQDQQDHLVPATGIFEANEWRSPALIAAKQLIQANEPQYPEMRTIIVNESQVTVESIGITKDGERFVAYYRREYLEKDLRATDIDGKFKPIDTTPIFVKMEMDPAIAKRLVLAWQTAILRAHYPDTVPEFGFTVESAVYYGAQQEKVGGMLSAQGLDSEARVDGKADEKPSLANNMELLAIELGYSVQYARYDPTLSQTNMALMLKYLAKVENTLGIKPPPKVVTPPSGATQRKPEK